MPSYSTHISQYSSQKSISIMTDLEQTPTADNLLQNQSGRVFNIFLDYDDATAAYVKMYDAKTAEHGTDQPIFVVPVIGTAFKQSIISQSGIKLSTACTMAASSNAGRGTGGSNPAGTVNVSISGT